MSNLDTWYNIFEESLYSAPKDDLAYKLMDEPKERYLWTNESHNNWIPFSVKLNIKKLKKVDLPSSYKCTKKLIENHEFIFFITNESLELIFNV